jgi:hypothetical protein
MIGRLLCKWGLHDWTRWELKSGTVWADKSAKPREVSVQTRECIRCGHNQIEIVKVKIEGL